MKREVPRPHWSADELALLTKHYPLVGARGCVALIKGRDANGIYAKARQLKLQAPRIKNPRREYPPCDRVDAAIRHVASTGNKRGDWLKLEKRFQRPRDYFSRRARQLGVTAAVFERNWHADEVALLRETSELRAAEAAAAFKRRGYKRTVHAIIRKRHLLKIDTTRYSRYSASEMAEMFGVPPVTILRAIDAGELTAKREKASGYFIVTDANVRAFLIAHPLRLDLRRMPPANVPWLIDLLTA
jgi:hypothetical protein